MKDFRLITVNVKKKGVDIHNPTSYTLIGKGYQGAVFRVSDESCVKVYAKKRHCVRESKALLAAQDSNFVPKVYEVGSNYILMEFIEGESLNDYLKSKEKFPAAVAEQLVGIFKKMKKVGFTRIDGSIRHFLVADDGTIKVIDHVNSMRSVSSRPDQFFRDLRKLKLLNDFMMQLKSLDPELYEAWTERKHIMKKRPHK
ncbi:serine/threonine protein kinase [Bacillus sp. M6-12]|uniref:AarF/UbiB family protein n=1 Tax=Bacillus sp. M6-12 TaxID=2054166 RepID=UPI000C77F985|nr:AarF/UbiB family protein [Bacillus sp. M6-12]PLS17537.1 serine/threonine protein kinase [Bacillus sp. M6-12]